MKPIWVATQQEETLRAVNFVSWCQSGAASPMYGHVFIPTAGSFQECTRMGQAPDLCPAFQTLHITGSCMDAEGNGQDDANIDIQLQPC